MTVHQLILITVSVNFIRKCEKKTAEWLTQCLKKSVNASRSVHRTFWNVCEGKVYTSSHFVSFLWKATGWKCRLHYSCSPLDGNGSQVNKFHAHSVCHMCCHLTMKMRVVLYDSDSDFKKTRFIFFFTRCNPVIMYNPGTEQQSLNICEFNRITYSMISTSYTIFLMCNTSLFCCCFDIFIGFLRMSEVFLSYFKVSAGWTRKVKG